MTSIRDVRLNESETSTSAQRLDLTFASVLAGMVWWAWLPGRNGNPGEGTARCILWVVARRGEAARGVGRPRPGAQVYDFQVLDRVSCHFFKFAE